MLLEHQVLQDRIEDVRQFRKHHQKLKDVIGKVLAGPSTSGTHGDDKKSDSNNSGSGAASGKKGTGNSALDELEEAYGYFVRIEVSYPPALVS